MAPTPPGVQYEPIGQVTVEIDEPAGQKIPGEQVAQDDGEAAPKIEEKYPAGQGKQSKIDVRP